LFVGTKISKITQQLQADLTEIFRKGYTWQGNVRLDFSEIVGDPDQHFFLRNTRETCATVATLPLIFHTTAASSIQRITFDIGAVHFSAASKHFYCLTLASLI